MNFPGPLLSCTSCLEYVMVDISRVMEGEGVCVHVPACVCVCVTGHNGCGMRTGFCQPPPRHRDFCEGVADVDGDMENKGGRNLSGVGGLLTTRGLT